MIDMEYLDNVHGKKIADSFLAAQGVQDTIINNIANDLSDVRKAIMVEHYGIKIDKNESDTKARISYMYDAVGFTPAAMDFANGVFNIGSWANAFFVKNCYPAMVKTDATIDYKLDPNNHSLKKDGTASDYDNLDYDGNAFAVFDCKIWLKMYEDENYHYIEVSNYKLDEDFHDYPYVNADGVHGDKLFYPMYPGYVYNGFLRSIAGVKPSSNSDTAQELNYAKNNGENYLIETWSHHVWYHMLLLLMSKNFNSQNAYGNGNMTGGSSTSDFKTNGEYYDKGMFFGTNSSSDPIKCFYCENVWGNRWSRCLGFFLDETAYSIKMVPPYTVSETGHEESGYTTLDLTVPSEGYIKNVSISTYGLLPTATGGTATTYVGDELNSIKNQVSLLLVGGACVLGVACGSWGLAVTARPSSQYWDRGASLYLIP